MVQSETVFHATLLSNFARAFDKYARAYDKTRIPESTHPGEFYVLPEADLAFGARKASGLLARLHQAGDALIALRAVVPAAALAPNQRNGIGRIWPSPVLPLCGVHELSADGTVGASIVIEDAMARSLRIHEAAFAPYDRLRPRSVSFLPIARGCQAACPFCFSEASVSADQRQGRFDPAATARWLDAAVGQGAERAVITGGGEPTLLPFADLLGLIAACRARFDKVVLITNGVALAEGDVAAKLAALTGAGLSVLAVSRHHHDEAHNGRLMNLRNHTPAIAAVRRAAGAASRLRLTCVLQRGGVDTPADIGEYVAWAAAIGADDVCFKELYVSTSHESVYHSLAANAWSASHQVPLSHVLDWAASAGFAEQGRLPWGAPVFRGQVGGRAIRVAAYTEPSLYWERANGIARSWNVMADGSCLASLEDRRSVLGPVAAGIA